MTNSIAGINTANIAIIYTQIPLKNSFRVSPLGMEK
jgi:hypothetical protein